MATPPPGAPAVCQELAECCICFDYLHAAPVAGLLRGARRCCVHFVHTACATRLRESALLSCPVCRAQWDDFVTVPPIADDPGGWFAAVDVDGNGALSQREVQDALKATLPVDPRRLDAEFPALWRRWDVDGNGSVDYAELFAPMDGLVDYIRRHFPRQASQRRPIPDLVRQPAEWFAHFDEDGSGTLEREEIVRGIVKTFHLSDNLAQVETIREFLTSTWFIFDTDNSGSIEVNEFHGEEGLAGMIAANIALEHGA